EGVVHGVYIREDQQHVGGDVPAEDGRHTVLVGDGVQALEAQGRVVVYRGPAPSTRDYDVPGGDEVVNQLPLDHGARSRAAREPLPWTRAMRTPSRARVTIVARLARGWRNWFEIVGRPPGGATALPPSATTMVPSFTAAQPSGARGREQACGAPGRAGPSTGHTTGRTSPDCRRRGP